MEGTLVKNVFPLWIFSSHSIVFGVSKLFNVVTKTTLKLKKLFVGWILKERDGNFDLLRAGDVCLYYFRVSSSFHIENKT